MNMKDVRITYQKDEEFDDLKINKPVYLFGKDIREIACFRNSFITGICCGVFGGLASFLLTSKTRMSTHVAFASLWIGVFGYWFPCRYKYETTYLISEKLNLRANIGKK